MGPRSIPLTSTHHPERIEFCIDVTFTQVVPKLRSYINCANLIRSTENRTCRELGQAVFLGIAIFVTLPTIFLALHIPKTCHRQLPSIAPMTRKQGPGNTSLQTRRLLMPSSLILSLINSKHYRIVRVLETHAHADHLTAASYLQDALARQQGFRPPVCIGKRIRTVQQAFGQRYGVPAQELEEAFDLLLEDGEVFYIGNLKVEVTHLPGHTPDHIGYMIADNVFCGDSVFIADLGTARCDFPGGDAKALYDSTRKLLSLPDHYRIWTGHDYPTSERQTPVPFMSVGDQKKQNRYLGDAVTATDFEKMRRERDAVLNEPKLLHPSLQINIRGGKMPRAAPDGQRYMHLPLKFSSQM